MSQGGLARDRLRNMEGWWVEVCFKGGVGGGEICANRVETEEIERL